MSLQIELAWGGHIVLDEQPTFENDALVVRVDGDMVIYLPAGLWRSITPDHPARPAHAAEFWESVPGRWARRQAETSRRLARRWAERADEVERGRVGGAA